MMLKLWFNQLFLTRMIRVAGLGTVAALLVGVACTASWANTITLLDDTWADGDRTSTSLPTDSPTYIGQSSGNGSNSVTAGALNFELPTNSLKVWTYFTSDLSAPDGNLPHNKVTHLNVGDMLTAEAFFTLPEGATAASTGKNFRLGLYTDPTDARVQADINSDGGGGTAPWTDATGYIVQLPLNSSSSGNNPLLIGKRTTSNSSLAGSSGAYTFATTGGNSYALAANTVYNVQLMLNVVSATQLDVTASILDGNTVLTTLTASDTGTAFGGTAINAGLLPGSQSIYTDFDQMFFRNSDSSQVNGTAANPTNGLLSFTNWRINHKQVPEPATLVLLGVGGLALAALRRRS